jgi:chemotaxis signal transduction protein
VNQRSTLVPVFDIHQVLHTKEAQSDQHTVLVLDQGNDAVGMCIDDIPQAVMLERRVSQTPPLPDPLAAHVVAAYSAGQTVWLDLDHRGLFTTLGAAIAVSSADSYP